MVIVHKRSVVHDPFTTISIEKVFHQDFLEGVPLVLHSVGCGGFIFLLHYDVFPVSKRLTVNNLTL